MKILVTGGAGFIGRNLVQALVRREHDVIVFDDFRLGDASLFSNIGVKVINGDVVDFKKIYQATKDVDVVYHLAAPSSFLMYKEDPVQSTVCTTVGTLNVLEAMRRNDVGKLIYASTSAVYEGNSVPYKEDMPLNPPDLKALSKKFGEEMAKQYSERYGIHATSLRPFSVYGYGEEDKKGYANVISLFTWAMLCGERPVIWGDGNQTRDFIFVDDVVEAALLAMEKNFSCEVFNVGTGVETSFNEVIKIINAHLGTRLQPIYVPVQVDIYAYRLQADVTKAQKLLGFGAKVPTQDGVATVIERARKTMTRTGRMMSTHQLRYTKL